MSRPFMKYGSIGSSVSNEDRIRFDVFMTALAKLCNEHRVMIDTREDVALGVTLIPPSEYVNVVAGNVL